MRTSTFQVGPPPNRYYGVSKKDKGGREEIERILFYWKYYLSLHLLVGSFDLLALLIVSFSQNTNDGCFINS